VIDYPTILMHLYRGRQWKISGNNFETLEWFDDGPVPTKAELDGRWQEALDVVDMDKNAQEEKMALAIAKLNAIGLTKEETQLLFGI
jgi:hypothetical protein